MATEQKPVIIVTDDLIRSPRTLHAALRHHLLSYGSVVIDGMEIARGDFHEGDILERLGITLDKQRSGPTFVLDSMAATLADVIKARREPPPSRWRFILCLCAVIRGARA